VQVSSKIRNFASVTKNLLMGFFDKKPKKDSGFLVASMNQTHGASIYPIMIPTIPTFGIGAQQTMMVTVIVMAV